MSRGQAWQTWTEVRQIPDANPRGIWLGPIFSSGDEGDLSRVVLRLDIRHASTGDLAVRLAYDGDGDGVPDVSAPIEFFRARTDPGGREFHACPQSLDGIYFFRDSMDEAERAFTPFRSLPAGHAFFLSVADTLAQEAGTLVGWAISTGCPD